ncbi:GGDEF domain-containing protein [Saccharopolyspora erythraea]|uniref:GGDEF domain-containing protein n=1 Tax=Saccharopolyspora erythraea TaxID=1836 RepID=UPI001BA7085B|nr:GGDEF domain-containing protein [Saccharopolyspora erythraea]QUH03876.1 GGDEF domain-containing protein [Saccharopolyspora erythraea]
MHDTDPLLARQIPDRDREVRFLLDAGRLEESEALFDDAIAAAPNTIEPGWDRSAVLAHRAILAWRLGRILLALELAAEAWAGVHTGRPAKAAAAHTLGMLGYLLEGHRAAAMELLGTAVRMAREAGAWETLAHCLLLEATAYAHRALNREDPDPVSKLARALVLFDETLSLPGGRAVRRRALAGSSRVLAALGEHARAEDRARAALDAEGGSEDLFCASVAHWTLSCVRRTQGRLVEARDFAASATDLAENIRDALLTRRYSQDLAAVCSELGDHAGEVSALRRAIRAGDATLQVLHAGLGQALEQHRLTAQAEQWAEAADRAATRDPLTGLVNRLGFDRRGPALVGRAVAHGGTPWMILFDVDRFKDINDRFGHLVGDFVLQETGRLVQRECGPDDLLCRWAGDEFVLLLRERTEQEGPAVAERIRRAVQQHDWHAKLGGGPSPTISVGVAAGPTTLPALFAAADRALYRAKNAGRNTIAVDTSDRLVGREVGISR